MAKIHIVGTSHISKDSIEKIKNTIDKVKPDIVAVELDKQRLYALQNNIKRSPSLSDIKHIGLQGFLFTIIGGYLQKKLGNIVGIKPGSDMLTAVNYGKQNNAEIELIDQNIQITMRRFSIFFSWKDKGNIIIDLLKGIFSKKERINIDLTKVPSEEVIERLMDIMQTRYKGIYKVLVHERNIFMAEKIYELIKKDQTKTIVAVIGAGHKKGIIEHLNNLLGKKHP
jgi:pheromone shutdown-related protein TraB